MKTLNEWVKDRGMEELSSDYGMITHQDEGLLDNQLEQLITRLEGLLHDVDETRKSNMIDKFMRQVEERILGL